MGSISVWLAVMGLWTNQFGFHLDVVDPRALLLRRQAEEAGRAVLVRVSCADFDVPRLGLRLGFLPRLRAHGAGAVVGHIDARLSCDTTRSA